MYVQNRLRFSALLLAFVSAVAFLPALAGPAVRPDEPARAKDSEPRDLQAEARDYIRRSDVQLPPELQKIREEVLSKIPAPCCKKFSAATCCCPCNFAKSIWGLSNTMLVEKRANAEQLRTAVLEWVRVNNPNGWTGDACFTGGCGRPFAKNGCGGMNDKQIVF